MSTVELFNEIREGMRPLPSHRWTVTIDDEPIGSVVTSHTVGVDGTGAWAKWVVEYDSNDDEGNEVKVETTYQAWVTSTRKHIIKVDDKDVEKDSIRVRVTTVGILPPRVMTIITLRFNQNDEGRVVRFDGRNS